jgi:hypothetical protein
MAEVVDDLRAHMGDAEWGRFSEYPWDDWCDGRTWQIQQGEDFHVAVPTMRVYLYQWRDAINLGEAPQPDTRELPSDEQIESGQIPQWTVVTRITGPGFLRFRFERVDEPPPLTK